MDVSLVTTLASHPEAGWAVAVALLALTLPRAITKMWHDWLEYRVKVKELEAPVAGSPPQALDVAPNASREAA